MSKVGPGTSLVLLDSPGPVGPWAARGLCSDLNRWDALNERQQQALCATCPVLDECRDWASGHRFSGVVVAGWWAPLLSYGTLFGAPSRRASG